MYTPLILKRATGSLLCLLLAFTAHSQTVFWGVGSTNGVAEAEFQNSFVQTGTPGSYSLTSWTALSISDNNGNNTPGAAYWVRDTTGRSQGAYATNMTPVLSPSRANGIALFDSDFLDNAGTRLPAGAGTGTSPSNQRGELISPRIDLTAARDSAILVEFFCQYRPFRISEWSVSMSTDDGLTWSTPTNINNLLSGTRNATSSGTVRWVLPNITQTLNLTECRLKFTFEGQYYYYIIDDISIKTAPEYDLAIGEADVDGNSYFTIGNLIRMSGNVYKPLVNINFSNPLGWAWGAKVINKGYKDLGSAQNPRLICQVDHTPTATGTTTSGIFYDTIYLDVNDPDNDTIYGNNKDGIAMVKDLTDLSFIQNLSDPVGRYDVTYWIEHDEMDGSADNDRIEHFFEITDYTNYNSATNRYGGIYHSKARRSPADGRTTRGGSIFPGGGPFSAFEYGSLYYFPTAGTDSMRIDSVDFRYYLRNAFNGAATQTVFINLYKFVDGSNGGTANGLISGDELVQIGLGPVTLNGLGTTLAAGNYHLGTCTNLVSALTGRNRPKLEDGSFYYVSLRIEPSTAGGVATFGANDVPTHAVDRLNYAMNVGNRTTTAPFSPSTMQTIDASGRSSWFSGFTGFDEVPSIGLFLSYKRSLLSTSQLPSQEDVSLSVFPNPTSDFINIAWEQTNKATDVQYVITDASGRVVYMQRVENTSQNLQRIDVSNLASGVYFVSAQTEQGVSTRRFLKK